MLYSLKDGRVFIVLKGDLDISNAETFKENCLAIAKKHKSGFTFECGELNFIDSTALGTFVSVNKHVNSYGENIVLNGLKPGLKKLFVITNLDTTIKIEG